MYKTFVVVTNDLIKTIMLFWFFQSLLFGFINDLCETFFEINKFFLNFVILECCYENVCQFCFFVEIFEIFDFRSFYSFDYHFRLVCFMIFIFVDFNFFRWIWIECFESLKHKFVDVEIVKCCVNLRNHRIVFLFKTFWKFCDLSILWNFFIFRINC